MIVPVIIGSIVDAEDIINVMELRCFDLFLLLTALFLLVVVAVLDIQGNFTLLPSIYFLHTQGIPHLLVAR